MKGQQEENVTLDEAKQAVALVGRRIALLHLAYARTLVDRLGKEHGTHIAIQAIKRYGEMIGKEVRKKVLQQCLPTTPENYGLGSSRSLPHFGVHEKRETVEVSGERRIRAYGCVLAKVWQEYGEEGLGRLYCYVDPAKYMAYNSDYKLAHVKALPDGDRLCEFCIRKTTAEEREAFSSEDRDWLFIDRCG